MSVATLSGKIILSGAGLVDTSIPANAKTTWSATFSFSDNSGKYLATDVQAGDLVTLDTTGADTATITSYTITSITSASFNEFSAVIQYVPSNNNPAGPPDISEAIGLIGHVGRRSPIKNLSTLPAVSIQLLPDSIAYQLANDNTFNIIDTMSAATSVIGGTAGALLFQSSTNVTTFLDAGTVGQILVSNGTSPPAWTDASSISIATATNVTGVVAIVNGGTGSTTAPDALVALGAAPASHTHSYQAADADLLAIGGLAGNVGLLRKTAENTWTLDTTAYGTVTGVTANAPIASSGGTAPVISMAAATASVPGYMTSEYASKLDGIASGATAYSHPTGDGALHVPATGTDNNGRVLTAGASAGSLSWVAPSSLTVSTATNVAGGTTGSLLFQTAVGTTSSIAPGTINYVLTSTGPSTAPSWQVAQVPTAVNTSVNLAGGVAGSIPYQTDVGSTGFTAAGLTNQVLVSNGSLAPTWTNTSSLTVSIANKSANLTGAAWTVPYQSAADTTTMLAVGATNTVLTSNGTAAAPSWQAVPTQTTATTQAFGDNTTAIATTAFVDRLRSSKATTATTASLTDRGNTIVTAAGVTIPANVFAAGDVFSVYNNSAATITLTSGAGLTMWLVGTALTGNRTLATRGIVTVYYISATEAVITGGGLA